MYVCIVQKKNGDYVGVGFQAVKGDEDATSSDEVHIYLDESGKVEKVEILPNGEEDFKQFQQTLLGFLNDLEQTQFEPLEDDSLESYRSGAVAAIRRLREFCSRVA